MALLKLSGERSFVAVHAAAELLGNVHIINLDAETLTGRETETFLLDFVVGDSDGEVIYRLLVLKSVDNLVHLKVAQMSLLMQKYRIQVRRAKGLSLKLVFCITKKRTGDNTCKAQPGLHWRCRPLRSRTKAWQNCGGTGNNRRHTDRNRQLNANFAVSSPTAFPDCRATRKPNPAMSSVYSKEVVDFVKVSAEYCLALENCRQIQPRDFVSKMLSVLPYIYVRAEALLGMTFDNGIDAGAQVTEEDYNYVRLSVYDVLGQYDEYLDVFVEDMKYSDRPILRTISEDLADIYQDLRNFLAVYREGIDGVSEAALNDVMENFRHDWGQKCVNVMRPLHDVMYNQMEEQDSL